MALLTGFGVSKNAREPQVSRASGSGWGKGMEDRVETWRANDSSMCFARRRIARDLNSHSLCVFCSRAGASTLAVAGRR